MNADLTWHQGRVTIFDVDNNFTVGSIAWPTPITAATNSHDVVAAVCAEFGWRAEIVDHDGDTIFAEFDADRIDGGDYTFGGEH